jgi:hypothetical protein
MEKLLIIKTTNTEKVKSILTKNHIEHQVVYDEPLTSYRPSSRKDKLREYIEAKSKEDIFSDYGKALKNKELEAEKSLLENDLD